MPVEIGVIVDSRVASDKGWILVPHFPVDAAVGVPWEMPMAVRIDWNDPAMHCYP